MESVKKRGHKKSLDALMNFLQNHPRYLPSDLMLNSGMDDRPLYTADQSFEKSLTNDLLLGISKIRNKARSAIMIRCGLNLEQTMGLTISDIDLEEKTLAVKLKNGSVAYYLTLNDDVVDAISAYLRVRSPTKEDKLFLFDSERS